MQKITNFLWFNKNALEAAKFYTSIFKNSKITQITKNTGGVNGKSGSIMVVGFTINGQDFAALNGGPIFKFNEAISFVVNCKDQKEVDYYWKKLSAGGKEVQCGWLKDKYGVSWQIVPNALFKYCYGKNKEGAKRAMNAMMGMVKLDVNGLKRAYEGK